MCFQTKQEVDLDCKQTGVYLTHKTELYWLKKEGFIWNYIGLSLSLIPAPFSLFLIEKDMCKYSQSKFLET